METDCPFCLLSSQRIIASSALTITIRDSFPVSPGHTLIISKRHVDSFFATTEAERCELLTALDHSREELNKTFAPDGYNIGINDGQASGQTVMHLHIHLIPRYLDDAEDPRGGVRWIFPEKAAYWFGV